jgi:VWFA-related protein
MPTSRFCHKLPFILLVLLLSTCLLGVDGEMQEANSSKQEAKADDDNFKIKVDVNLVTTDVSVAGIPASELRAEDFTIYDNNVAQEITYFSHDELPLAVAILIDSSGSIAERLSMLQIAALSSLRHLKPVDQVALFSFAEKHRMLCGLTEDRSLIAKNLNNLKIEMGTNIYDTIFDAMQYLKKNAPHRRRAIILISDNCHVGSSQYSSNQCYDELLESSITLYNIRTTSTQTDMDFCKQSDERIRRFADDTGGEALNVGEPTAIKTALEKAISSFRMQYTLGFNPSNPGTKGSFHRLAIKLVQGARCPGCKFLTRSGYYAEVAGPLSHPEEIPNTPRNSAQNVDEILLQRSVLTAGTVALEMKDIPFNVSTAEQTDSKGQPQLKVNLQIFIDNISFDTKDEWRSCKLRIAIFYADKKRNILGSDWRQIEGRFNSENYSRAIKTGISYTTVIPLKAKNQLLNIVIYDETSDKMGSKLVQLHNAIPNP